MILITAYKRPQMLLDLLRELQGENVVVFDDGSDYDYSQHKKYCTYKRASFHRGKEYFWKQWQWMLDVAKRSDDSWFLFLQDDVGQIDLPTVRRCCNALDGKYAFNIMNRGNSRGWTRVRHSDCTIAGLPCRKVSYVDCNFACSRQTLETIDWQMDQVPITRFSNDSLSSGVGQQLSEKFAFYNVPMYKPIKSLAQHLGSHDSKMHKDLRKRQPLIAR